MTEDQRELLIRAQESLAAAKYLLAGGFSAIVGSCAYYAMFHVAQAFLEGGGMAFSRHSAVIAAFGQHFANAEKVPLELHRMLIDAESARLSSDYRAGHTITAAQAQQQIAYAEQFLSVAERVIGSV